MKVINNKEEFEEFFPYPKKDQIREYPKEYPCVCKWEHEGGGLMGDYRQPYVAYFPKEGTLQDAFLDGLKQPWIILKL
jgi:hypothetical protein